MFLLDTSVVSELRKPRPHGAVLAWYSNYPLRHHRIPAIALYEMQVGVELTRMQDPEKARAISAWIDRMTATIGVLPFDGESARLAARFMHGKPSELVEDAMIAAIAVVHGLTVATRNTRDFERFPAAILNPFEFRGP